MSEHEHRWGRENRQGQCDCGLCRLPDPRGLDCAGCSAYLSPGDADFDELYEAAPWWYDVEDDEEQTAAGPFDIDAALEIPVISVRRGGIRFPSKGDAA
jgi:hypothetical protein